MGDPPTRYSSFKHWKFDEVNREKVQLEKKEEIWLSHMTKSNTPTEMSTEQSENTNNATKKFDYKVRSH